MPSKRFIMAEQPVAPRGIAICSGRRLLVKPFQRDEPRPSQNYGPTEATPLMALLP